MREGCVWLWTVEQQCCTAPSKRCRKIYQQYTSIVQHGREDTWLHTYKSSRPQYNACRCFNYVINPILLFSTFLIRIRHFEQDSIPKLETRAKQQPAGTVLSRRCTPLVVQCVVCWPFSSGADEVCGHALAHPQTWIRQRFLSCPASHQLNIYIPQRSFVLHGRETRGCNLSLHFTYDNSSIYALGTKESIHAGSCRLQDKNRDQ